jgi:hexosaminidase
LRKLIKLNFCGDINELSSGLQLLKKELNFETEANGLQVHVTKHSNAVLHVAKEGNSAQIEYRDTIHFFRGLGLLVQNIPIKDEFDLTETVAFDMNGTMFDVSQGNSVINVEHVKKFLRKMSVMGLNMLMLYTEDSYEVENWDYFGYMRGRYTQADLKELDDYAFSLGIEIIPCIQTLAHLVDALKWRCFEGMRDNEDILLVGNEKVYQFIEDMIVSATRPLRTKRIHIGMDEASLLGQGVFLLKNGYKNKSAIMLEHLERVIAITSRLGLEPMIWSDMFFRAASKTGDYYDREIEITQDVINSYPKDVQLVYWDYYHKDEEFYIDWIRRHKKFGPAPVFAGGIWTWSSFSPNWAKTFATTNAAMNACKKEGVREVFATVWGDDSTECNIDTNLLGMLLFAEHGYSKDLDMKKLEERFRFITGAELSEFLELNELNEVPGTMPGNENNFNATKILMWQDILCGLFDKDIEGLSLNKHYEKLCAKFACYRQKPSEMSEVYGFYERVASVLSIKAEIGLQINAAYDRKNKNELSKIANHILPELMQRVIELKNYHRDVWMKANKALGWETFDLRYGCLMNRIDTAASRLNQYCGGSIDTLEELDEEKKYFLGTAKLAECNRYATISSASRFSFYNIPYFPM